ncbi:MAG: hypothetical protein IJ019_02325 [Alphaproteobacteria bacterium]|nr:hypothetical protein [Alphaproteobacteria bacterium]
MQKYEKDLKQINTIFYRLIKLLKRYHFEHTAHITSYAYEELLSELLDRYKNKIN